MLEDERDAAALEHARAERLGLQRERAIEQCGELCGGELGAREESARQARKSRCASFALILLLSWNIFHGRAEPAAGRPLAAEFAATLAGWSWDVALLQEVPPWWPARLGAATGASVCMTLTSRNQLLFARRAIAARNPDLLGAGGGGCNAILVRRGRIREHRTLELTRRPERRVMHGIALDGAGWVVNLHGSLRPARAAPRRPVQGRRDVRSSGRRARRSCSAAT